MGRGMWLLSFSFLFPLSPEASAEDKAIHDNITIAIYCKYCISSNNSHGRSLLFFVQKVGS